MRCVLSFRFHRSCICVCVCARVLISLLPQYIANRSDQLVIVHCCQPTHKLRYVCNVQAKKTYNFIMQKALQKLFSNLFNCEQSRFLPTSLLLKFLLNFPYISLIVLRLENNSIELTWHESIPIFK